MDEMDDYYRNKISLSPKYIEWTKLPDESEMFYCKKYYRKQDDKNKLKTAAAMATETATMTAATMTMNMKAAAAAAAAASNK